MNGQEGSRTGRGLLFPSRIQCGKHIAIRGGMHEFFICLPSFHRRSQADTLQWPCMSLAVTAHEQVMQNWRSTRNDLSSLLWSRTFVSSRATRSSPATRSLGPRSYLFISYLLYLPCSLPGHCLFNRSIFFLSTSLPLIPVHILAIPAFPNWEVSSSRRGYLVSF